VRFRNRPQAATARGTSELRRSRAGLKSHSNSGRKPDEGNELGRHGVGHNRPSRRGWRWPRHQAAARLLANALIHFVDDPPKFVYRHHVARFAIQRDQVEVPDGIGREKAVAG
jgi:hypothetical protein